MDDLIAFFEARLREDEGQTRCLDGEQWELVMNVPDEPDWTVCHRPEPRLIEGRADVWREDMGVWIADHDPARVLREVAAKRAILAEYERVAGSAKAYPNNATITALGVAQTMLRALATAWNDHPDYREAWRP